MKKKKKLFVVNDISYIIKFKQVKKIGEEELVCDKYCPLNDICGKNILPDPHNVGSLDFEFNDYCLREGDKPLAPNLDSEDNSSYPILNLDLLRFIKNTSPRCLNKLSKYGKFKYKIFKLFKLL